MRQHWPHLSLTIEHTQAAVPLLPSVRHFAPARYLAPFLGRATPSQTGHQVHAGRALAGSSPPAARRAQELVALSTIPTARIDRDPAATPQAAARTLPADRGGARATPSAVGCPSMTASRGG